MAFGNYFGALANWVKLQSIAAPEDKLFFSIVSWQAFRLKLPQDPSLLWEAWTTVIAPILVKRASFFHREEVTPVVRRLLSFLVMGRRGLRTCIAHIFNHENDMCALADPGTCSQVHRVSRRCEYSIFIA